MKKLIILTLTLILALISLISGRGIAMCRAETVETPLYILLEDAESEDLEVEYTHETDYGTKVPGYGTDNHGNRYGDVYYSNGESYWADLSLDGAYTEFAGTVFVQERIPMVGKSSGSAKHNTPGSAAPNSAAYPRARFQSNPRCFLSRNA